MRPTRHIRVSPEFHNKLMHIHVDLEKDIPDIMDALQPDLDKLKDNFKLRKKKKVSFDNGFSFKF